jgi:hypothetical protein
MKLRMTTLCDSRRDRYPRENQVRQHRSPSASLRAHSCEVSGSGERRVCCRWVKAGQGESRCLRVRRCSAQRRDSGASGAIKANPSESKQIKGNPAPFDSIPRCQSGPAARRYEARATSKGTPEGMCFAGRATEGIRSNPSKSNLERKPQTWATEPAKGGTTSLCSGSSPTYATIPKSRRMSSPAKLLMSIAVHGPLRGKIAARRARM